MAFVNFDPENGDLALKLPEAYRSFEDELCAQLTEIFMDRLGDESVVASMNDYVENWLQRQGKGK